MAVQPTHDPFTLKNVTGESDSTLFLSLDKKPKKPVTEHVQPSGILARLRSFLPQMAAANQALNSGVIEKIDVQVSKVDLDIDESDTSTDEGDSGSEVESEEENAEVEFDLSLFRAQRTSDENDTDMKPEVEQLPEGFREPAESPDGSPADKKPRKMVEEL